MAQRPGYTLSKEDIKLANKPIFNFLDRYSLFMDRKTHCSQSASSSLIDL